MQFNSISCIYYLILIIMYLSTLIYFDSLKKKVIFSVFFINIYNLSAANVFVDPSVKLFEGLSVYNIRTCCTWQPTCWRLTESKLLGDRKTHL